MTAELVDPVTGEVVVFDQKAARARADRIRNGLDDLWTLITEAYAARDWLALGHATWDAYCDAEFRGSLSLAREHRAAVVGSMARTGMPTRAIGSALGLSKDTVHRELSQTETAEPPVKITGLDGKTYTRPEPKPATEAPTVKDVLDADPGIQQARLEHQFSRACQHVLTLTGFPPEVVGGFIDDEEAEDLDRLVAHVNEWHRLVKATRPRHLTVIGGGK